MSPILRESLNLRYPIEQFSDYALLGSNGRPLAVVEAKKTAVDVGVGQEQAKQYYLNIQKQKGGDLPFCFYTNGHNIFFWDIDNYPPRKINGFFDLIIVDESHRSIYNTYQEVLQYVNTLTLHRVLP